LIETGVNTGVFTLELKLPAVQRTDGKPLADGDVIKVEWKDNLFDPPTTVSATTTIGVITAKITFDRDVYPVTAGDRVKVKITIDDPDENVDARIAETIIVGDHRDEYIVIRAADGTILQSIANFTAGRRVLFTETGINTGIFTATIDVDQSRPAADRQWINAKLKIVYYDETAGKTVDKEVIFQNSDTLISVDKAIARYGETFKVTVNDPDRNLDSEKRENDTVKVYVVWTDRVGANATAISKDAEETGPNTGVFVAEFKVGETVGGVSFRPKPGSNLEIRVFDRTPIGLTPAKVAWPTDWTEWSRRVALVRVPSHTGTLTLSATEIGPGGIITITLRDPDENVDIATKDVIDGRGGRGSIRVKTDSDPMGYTMYIEETGITTNVFERKIKVIPRELTAAEQRATDPTVTAQIYGRPGDKMSITYVDREDATGAATTLTREVAIKSWDPVITFEKATYMPGDLLRVFITDPDANKDPDTIDVIPSPSPIETGKIIQKLIITSTSDPIGVSLSAVETDKNSGRFVAQIPLSGEAGITGTLYVRIGDTVTIHYKDEFPVDWVTRIGAAEDKAKTFTASVVIRSPIPTIERVPASTPELVDATGAPITTPKVGQLCVVRAKVTNRDVVPNTFTYIVQVKDAAGVVIYIAWIQDITLAPGASATPGITWIPPRAGSYTVEVYVWESLEKPVALSPVFSKTITVT
ncbi:MAG: hypothetical protein NZ896_04720, partial [Nitrososphaerales archaeon]|nr:hypothetical protein [Nitrososphaerales archaeon]